MEINPLRFSYLAYIRIQRTLFLENLNRTIQNIAYVLGFTSIL